MTRIEWTDRVWNPCTGCTKVSEGCRNCYAEVMAKRTFGRLYRPVLAASGKSLDTISTSHHEDYLETGLARPRRFTDVQCHDDRLDAPLRWRRPSRVFVNSMSDLFHQDVPDEFIDRVFAVMVLTPQHTYQVLTKRPERMRAYLSHTTGRDNVLVRALAAARAMPKPDSYRHADAFGWPYRNVWLGVSIEDQPTTDQRIPELLATPAAVRFVSYEPALGPVNFEAIANRCGSLRPCCGRPSCEYCDGTGTALAMPFHWLIVGGESGPKARPTDVSWIRSAVEQCKAAGVACFVKQDSGRFPGQQGRIPDDLWIKEWPNA